MTRLPLLLSSVALATSFSAACMTAATDDTTGAADHAAAKAVAVKPAASCGTGEPVKVYAPTLYSAGNVIESKIFVNCGADGIEVCWDGYVGRSMTAATAALTVRRTGDRSARCAEDRMVYIDISSVSEAVVDKYEAATYTALTLNNDASVFYTADIYGGFDHEYTAMVGKYNEAAPDVIVAPFGNAELSALSIANALDIPLAADRPVSSTLYVSDADSANEFLEEKIQRSSYPAYMIKDIQVLVNGRLADLRLVTNNVQNITYVVGKTTDGELAAIIF